MVTKLDIRKLKSFVQVRVFLLAAIAPLLAGCLGNIIPSLREPDRLYSIDEEIRSIKNSDGKAYLVFGGSREARNAFISERMYAIDILYTKYESQLTHEGQDIGFLSDVVQTGLTSTAAIIGPPGTAHILSAIATGTKSATSSYDNKILLANATQNLQTQMRTDRNDQAAVILASMKCSNADYPIGSAMSDLELYYRAGTIPSALIGLSRTVAKAEIESKAYKEAKTPASPPSAVAQLKVSANVTANKASLAGCPRQRV